MAIRREKPIGGRDGRSPLVTRDGYDDAAFDRSVAAQAGFDALLEAGQRLMPDFGELARDVFATLFKYAVLQREIGPEALLAARIMGWIRESPGFDALNAETTLDEVRAGFATASLMGQVLHALRDGELFSQDELLAGFELAEAHAHLERARDFRDALTELDSEAAERDAQAAVARGFDASQPSRDEGAASGQRAVSQEALDAEVDALERAVQALARAQQRRIERLPARVGAAMREVVSTLPHQMRQAEEAAEALTEAMGAGPESLSTQAKLDLGRRLAGSEKLQKLMRLVGAFRPYALGARRRRFERRPSEVHAVERGGDLGRLIPCELVALRHPALRQDFLRRMLERGLLQYAIAAEERAGRGPMVLCLDGSSSMQGPKELWAKAVALTLVELCRRERRAFQAVVFSARATETRQFELLPNLRPRGVTPPPLPMATLVEFAEYFPRGGTRFEQPLELAVEILSKARWKGGDIVLVTDGEAYLGADWLAWFHDQRRALGFKLHAVLVDVGSHRTQALDGLADVVTRVTELTIEAAGSVFS